MAPRLKLRVASSEVGGSQAMPGDPGCQHAASAASKAEDAQLADFVGEEFLAAWDVKRQGGKCTVLDALGCKCCPAQTL